MKALMVGAKISGMEDLLLHVLRFALTGLVLHASAQKPGTPCTYKDWKPCKLDDFKYHRGPNDLARCLKPLRGTEHGNNCRVGENLRIMNRQEQDYYEEVLKPDDFTGHSLFWLDLLYDGAQNFYYWRPLTNSFLRKPPTYTNWKNGSHAKFGAGRCPAISLTEHYQWTILQCSKKLSSLCVLMASTKADHTTRSVKIRRLDSNGELVPGDDLKAECTVVAPIYHILSWFRTNSTGTYILKFITSSSDYTQNFIYNEKQLCQRHLYNTREIRINGSAWLNANRLSCGLITAGESDPKCEMSSNMCDGFNITVKVLYHTLDLRVEFHYSGQTVFRDLFFNASCISCGPPDHNYTFHIQETYLNGTKDELEIDESDKRVHVSNLPNTDTKNQSTCNGMRVARLSLKVGHHLKDMIMWCAIAWTAHRKGERVMMQSPRISLFVKTSPSVPHLYVAYQEPPGGVYLDQNFSAKCSGCLGDVGSLRWAVEGEHGPVSEEELDLFIIDEDLVEDTLVSTECVKQAQSSILLWASIALHEKRLACHLLHDYPDTNRSAYVAYSSYFNVIIEGNHPLDKSTLAYIMIFLAASLFFLLFFVVCCILMGTSDLRDKKNKGGKYPLQLARRREVRGADKASSHTNLHHQTVRMVGSTCVDTGHSSYATGSRWRRWRQRSDRVFTFFVKPRIKRKYKESPYNRQVTNPQPEQEPTDSSSATLPYADYMLDSSPELEDQDSPVSRGDAWPTNSPSRPKGRESAVDAAILYPNRLQTTPRPSGVSKISKRSQ